MERVLKRRGKWIWVVLGTDEKVGVVGDGVVVPRIVQVVVYVVRVSSNLTAVRERQRGREV